MLIKCKECELQVSDKALSCPHCGYPLTAPVKRAPRSTKRRRLPNGFGQITKLNRPGLRKPYRAMVTIGLDSNGRYKQVLLKPVSYFETYNDAYQALLNYNLNPYDLETSSYTLQDLYNKWSSEYFKKLNSDSSIRTVKAAWSRCTPISKMQVRDIRTRHIKGLIEDTDTSENMKRRIKSLFNLMLDYAVEYELTDKNYARNYTIETPVETENSHMIYTAEEIKKINASDDCMVKRIILLQNLSGWRPQELCNIKLSDINLDDMTIIGGMKTDSGKNRIVPIHSMIYDNVRKWYEESVNINSEYLFHKPDGTPYTYNVLRHKYTSYISELKLDSRHKPHDGRKHFITLAKKYNVDEWVLKRIVGHTINDITEQVYTVRNIDDFRTEIEKIRAQF